MYITFTDTVNKEQQDLLDKILKYIDLDCKQYCIDNYDLSSLIDYRTYAIFSFGKKANNAVSIFLEDKKLNKTHYKFLHPSFYIKRPENEINRKNLIKEIDTIKVIEKDRINISKIEITEKDLPDISSQQTVLLNKLLQEKNLQSTYLVNKNGQQIEIGNVNSQYPSLSIEELFLLKTILETFNVKHITIQKRNSDA